MPYNGAATVTLHDTDLLPKSGAIYIGTAGDGTLKVTTENNEDVAFVGVVAGWFGELEVKRVWSTGTGASNIVVAY